MEEETNLEYGVGLNFNGEYRGLIMSVNSKAAGEISVRETNSQISGESLRAVLYRREVIKGHWQEFLGEGERASMAESGLEKTAETTQALPEDFWLGYGCEEKPLKIPVLLGFWEEEGCYGPGFDK